MKKTASELERVALTQPRYRKLGIVILLMIILSRYIQNPKRRLAIAFGAVLGGLIASQGAKKFPDRLMPTNTIKWYPIIGHFLWYNSFRKNAHSEILQMVRKENWKSFFVSFPQVEIFVALDETDRKHILKDNWLNYQKNYDWVLGFDRCFQEVLGNGIFNVDGDKWKCHRKISSNLFTSHNMGNIMSKVFVEHAEILKQQLFAFAERQESFDIQMLMQCLIFDAFCEIAFGISPHSFEKSINGVKDEFLVAFDNVQLTGSLRFFDPPLLRELRKTFKTGLEADFQQNLDIVNSCVYKIIADRLENNESKLNDQGYTDILGLYIEHARAKNMPELLDPEYLRDVIVNIMIAGRDTTSYVLTNIFSLLAENPDMEEMFVKEAEVQLKNGAKYFAEHGVKEFPLGDAIFYEALRMYPSVGDDPRFCQKDDVLPSGIHIPKGTMVMISNISCGRNPAYCDAPDEFRPLRWIKDGACEKPDEFRYPFFWAGNRTCLGKDMARFESKLITAILFKDLKFSLAKPRVEDFVVGPVMFYKNGMHMKARPRHPQHKV